MAFHDYFTFEELRFVKLPYTNLNSPIKSFSFWIHLVFWFTYLAFYSLISYEGNWLQSFRQQLLLLPTKLFVTYFNYHVLLPLYFFRKKYLKFCALLIPSIILAALIEKTILIWVISPGTPFLEVVSIAKLIMLINSLILFTTVVISLLRENHYTSMISELENQNIRIELDSLKSQLEPHFLFNTLNNLYGLVLEKSEKAPQVIMRLSGLLRFMLQANKKSTIPLTDEILYLRDYIELEKLRFNESTKITFETVGDMEKKKIPPLLFLPAIENSFKYGINKNDDQSFIEIEIQTDNQSISLNIVNSIGVDQQVEKLGTGLDRLEKRLTGFYGDAYTVTLTKSDKCYRFFLNIPINAEKNNT